MNLNSSPMFAASERDLIRMPKPSRYHVALKDSVQFTPDMVAVLGSPQVPANAETFLKAELEKELAAKPADPQLIRLHGMHLKGTFFKAYSILARMVGMIGWEELLRVRSEVFVMEEEYQGATPLSGSRNGSHERLPQNKKSTEEEDEPLTRRKSQLELAAKTSEQEAVAASTAQAIVDGAIDAITTGVATLTPDESASQGKERAASPAIPTESEVRKASKDKASPLHQKRLCERWLDSLFMTLFEVFKDCFLAIGDPADMTSGSAHVHTLAG